MHLLDLRHLVLICMVWATTTAVAQSDDRIAFVPHRAPEHTADDEALGFRAGTVPGQLELSVPAGTWQVDILNARGNVVDQFEEDELLHLDLAQLPRGTWTLRAHTPFGYAVRRFVVMQPGRVAWAVTPTAKRH